MNEDKEAKVQTIVSPAHARRKMEDALQKLLMISEGARNVMIMSGDAHALLGLFWQTQKPIPMLMFCPMCGLQHVDKEQPEHWRNAAGEIYAPTVDQAVPAFGSGWHHVKAWDNPPHKSHLCHGCMHIWRPCDIPTTGVAALTTAGTADGSPIPARAFELLALLEDIVDADDAAQSADAQPSFGAAVDKAIADARGYLKKPA